MPKKLDKCVSEVKKQGNSESSSYAICNDSMKAKKKDINYYKKLLKDELNNINEEEFKKLYIGVWN